VWIVNDKLAVIVASGTDLTPSEATDRVRSRSAALRWDRIFEVAAGTGSAVRSPETADGATIIVAPITVDLDVTAFLMTVEEKRQGSGDFALLATEHAATVCGVMLSRERALAAAAGRARDDLIEALLLGRASDPDELDRWARHLGLDTSVPNRVMLVSAAGDEVGSDRRSRVDEIVKHFCESRGAGVVTGIREGEVVVLLPDDPPGGPTAEQLGAECLAYCRDLFPGVRFTIGISGVCSGAADLSRAYDEARRTVDAAARLRRHDAVVTFDGLGIHRLLLQLPELDELRTFADDVLGPLLRYDRLHGSRLIDTLVAFFQDGPGLRRMADRLHVHPNTVTYRLRRIGEIAELDLDRYRDRLTAQVALEILEILGPNDE
jgi:sugar diacid utilization regulator